MFGQGLNFGGIAEAPFVPVTEQIQWLVVAAGGGSGSNAGGGGGAGGLRTSAGPSGGGCSAEGLGTIAGGRTYTITVGSGGAAGGANGGNSSIANSVWTNNERTLSATGISAYDVWNFANRTLSAASGATAFEMFISDKFCMNGCIFNKEVLA